jgi:hypothetical protein
VGEVVRGRVACSSQRRSFARAEQPDAERLDAMDRMLRRLALVDDAHLELVLARILASPAKTGPVPSALLPTRRGRKTTKLLAPNRQAASSLISSPHEGLPPDPVAAAVRSSKSRGDGGGRARRPMNNDGGAGSREVASIWGRWRPLPRAGRRIELPLPAPSLSR